MATFADLRLALPERSTFSTRAAIVVPPDSLLIHGVFEARSEVDPAWLALFGTENVLRIEDPDDLATFRVPSISHLPLSLRRGADLDVLADRLETRQVFLDITGLAHHIWMPILRVLVSRRISVSCIYVEPEVYTGNPRPRPGEFFDLSDRIRGLSPIPTFARLRSRERKSVLVPFLGFEGARFKHLVDNMEPADSDIYPVIGIPGFRMEYPNHTFEGNADVLASTRSWLQMEFIDAACPFAAFKYLEFLRLRYPDRLMELATIGTKPHALGATLFALRDANSVLVYDHPVRRLGRTSGTARHHVYRVSAFLAAK